MKLLIEDFPYPTEKVLGLLEDIKIYEQDGLCRIPYVGYFYNSSIKDCVFILPKVILDYHDDDRDDTIFGKFSPIDIIDIDESFRQERLKPEQCDFLYNFSTWIYRAISEFARINAALPEKQRSNIVHRKLFSDIKQNGSVTDGTLIDIILSLIRFANENRDFFMFTIKNIHSGHNKINWNKTIASKTAFFQKGNPFYIETINKKKQINFEEELLIIFYSILQYLKQQYGFLINIPVNYELINFPKFESYLNGLGRTKLLQIKYRYFSDKALRLWNLCYCFFARTEQMALHPDKTEYLYVSDFDIVFETMIDDLISDKDVPDALRNQRDGKIVDHIYRYPSLISPDNNIYYIGDSKYYKIGGSVHGYSVYKQYTYVRNILHFNRNLWLDNDETSAIAKGALPYVDKMTDGYDVTPNFFLSAEIDSKYRYSEAGIRLRKNNDGKSHSNTRHFNNRLFDRDTLWLSHYNVNFLYILNLFVSGRQRPRTEFNNRIRSEIRKNQITLLGELYEFYRFNFSDNASMEEFVSKNFRELSGKIFHFGDTLLLALKKGEQESEALKLKYQAYTLPYELRNPEENSIV